MNQIKDFQPNTHARAAAESLAGLRALGVIKAWNFHNERFRVEVETDEGFDMLVMTAPCARAFASGALAAMRRWVP